MVRRCCFGSDWKRARIEDGSDEVAIVAGELCMVSKKESNMSSGQC